MKAPYKKKEAEPKFNLFSLLMIVFLVFVGNKIVMHRMMKVMGDLYLRG
jgi:hypothetical protein